jgi:CBS-domain-containing membrane protein
MLPQEVFEPRNYTKSTANRLGGHKRLDERISSLQLRQMNYFQKMRGCSQCPPCVSPQEVLWSWLGAFLGISAVALLHHQLLSDTDLVLIIGSFGASAVLLYGAVKSPLAQPRNLLGGHLLSALIGVVCFKLLGGLPWLAAAVAVSTAIAAMHATRTLHPPGGATALIAVIGSDHIHSLGFLYVLMPTGLGALVMLVVALLINNIPASRRYPEFWF